MLKKYLENLSKKIKLKNFYTQYAHNQHMVILKTRDRLNGIMLLLLISWFVLVYAFRLEWTTMLVGLAVLLFSFFCAYGHMKKIDQQALKKKVWKHIGETVFIKKIKAMNQSDFETQSQLILSRLTSYRDIKIEDNNPNGRFLTGFYRNQPIIIQCLLLDEDNFLKTNAIRNFISVMASKGIVRGMIVTNGDFSENSYQLGKMFTEKHKLTLIDGKTLIDMARVSGVLLTDTECEHYVEQQVAQQQRQLLKDMAINHKGSGTCFVYGVFLLGCSIFLKPFVLYYLSAIVLFLIGLFKLVHLKRHDHQQIQQPIWDEE